MKFRPTKKTRFLTYKTNPKFKNTLGTKTKCPSCQVINIYKRPDKLFGECKTCGIRLYFYIPHELQALAHQITNRTVLMFSGVSSGKSTGNAWTVIEHALTNPKAAIYVMAQTVEQRDKNIKDQILRPFIDEDQDLRIENQTQWTFHNHSTIYFYTSDDYQKLKSANATMLWLVEAQGFDVELYFESQQRARSINVKTFKRDKKDEIIHKKDPNTKKLTPVILEDRALILVEGNIDPNSWIRKWGALQSHTIIGTPNTMHYKLKNVAKPPVLPSGEIKDVVSIIMSPFDNYYNSQSFLDDLKLGKPKNWVNTEVFGDLSLQSGLLIPSAPKHIINTNHHPSFSTTHDYLWIEAMDFGGAKITNDPTAYLLGKWNQATGEIVIVAEYYQSGTNIATDIRAISTIRKNHNFDLQRSAFFVCDPSGRRSLKTDIGKKDLISYYKEGGLTTLKPAFKSKGANTYSNILVSSGIVKINEFLDSGILKFDYSLTNLNAELANYRHRREKLATEETTKSKSIKTMGSDHAIDALRYMIMEIPFTNNFNLAAMAKKRYNEKTKAAQSSGRYNFLASIMFRKKK